MHGVWVAEGAVGGALVVLPERLHEHLHEPIHLLRLPWQTKATARQVSG